MKYVNCFNRLRFLVEISTKLWEMHFSRQIKGHNSGRKLKNQTNDLIFSSTFSAVFVTFIFVFENSQNLFSCGPPFDPFWSVKSRNFWQTLPIWTTTILLQKVNTLQPTEFTTAFSICRHGATINKNHDGKILSTLFFMLMKTINCKRKTES